jgi:hypothetical protein
MMSIWRPHHHICENFPSVLRDDTADGTNECTGNRLYMWGGLPALISLMEAGLYQP